MAWLYNCRGELPDKVLCRSLINKLVQKYKIRFRVFNHGGVVSACENGNHKLKVISRLVKFFTTALVSAIS